MKRIVVPLAMMTATPSASVWAKPRYEAVTLETDFEGQNEARTQRVQPALEARIRESLEARHDIELDPDARTELVVSIRNVDEAENAAESVGDYGAGLVVRVDGEVVGEKIVHCMQVGEAQLVECAVEGLDEVVPWIPVEEASEAAVVEETPPPPQTELPEPIGPLGIAGAVLVGVGVAGVAAGAVLLTRPETEAYDTTTYSGLERRSFRVPGIAAVGVGAALLIGGSIMLGKDLADRKKQRKRAASVAPMVTPQGAWISITGRF